MTFVIDTQEGCYKLTKKLAYSWNMNHIMCIIGDLLKKENLELTQELIHSQEWFLSDARQMSVITEYFFCL